MKSKNDVIDIYVRYLVMYAKKISCIRFDVPLKNIPDDLQKNINECSCISLYKLGDCLSKIGAKFGVAWQDIANLNSIAGPNYVIYAGQVLKIPSGNVTPQPTPQPTYKTYKVVRGDTLSGIGQKFGVSWKKIAEVNDVKPPLYLIYVGQTLKIPN